MSDKVNRFLGDTPVRVLVKLVVVSLVVGFVMNAFNWSPYDLFWAVRNFFLKLWNMGFAALGDFADYVLLGAAVVIPLFIILRLINYNR